MRRACARASGALTHVNVAGKQVQFQQRVCGFCGVGNIFSNPLVAYGDSVSVVLFQLPVCIGYRRQ